MTQSKTKLEIIQRIKDETTLTFILNPTDKSQVVPSEFVGRKDLLSQQPVLGSLESWQAVIISKQ